MFIINDYALAIVFCIITMLCWGSWANTQKLAEKTWRFELFYWDYVIGILLFSLISAFTLGSIGEQGRTVSRQSNRRRAADESTGPGKTIAVNRGSAIPGQLYKAGCVDVGNGHQSNCLTAVG